MILEFIEQSTPHVSLRASAHTGVAISFDFRPDSYDLMGIATPV